MSAPNIVPIGSDSESDFSEGDMSEGGMQLDPPNLAHSEFLTAGVPAVSDAHELQGTYSTVAPDPFSPSYLRSQARADREDRQSQHIREEKHAALAVLMNRELLLTHALSSRETIPQTRRRFFAKLIAPDDPAEAEKIQAERFVIPSSDSGDLPGSTTAGPSNASVRGGWPVLVPGKYHWTINNDVSGWRNPRAGIGIGTGAGAVRKARAGGSRSASGSAAGSRSGSRSKAGSASPAQRAVSRS
ncbi:hypothetical protein NUU61_010187 [Penicillium alfredii]|uniref:Uncharacterized protein n=1 Tax=Penicillium alfredii TaxID=1506179 RepID=A0A9W9EHI9_9EURO|nr:uncharacterized protein NUU61_010187 [Penicillium alfredii]KAJ5081923.1 hypothetical protein NUU61_010187 [Penicillium alfredii]